MWEEGGRLRHFVEGWKGQSKDHWLLQTPYSLLHQGVKIEFVARPYQDRSLIKMEMRKSPLVLCNQEIRDLVRKEAVAPIDESGQCFVSDIFITK